MQQEIKTYLLIQCCIRKTSMFMKKIFYLIALVAITLTSCDKNETNLNNIAINESKTGQLIKKVKKLENPYSVSNMKKAYSALQQEGLMKTALNIEATHLYVRFLPKDSAELETMFGDTTLTLFSYPLDYELTEGETYIDSTLIGNEFTWLYTRVPVGFTSPIRQYEVIEQLYLPTLIENDIQDINSQKVSGNIGYDWWYILENKSLELTGNSNSVQKINSTQNIQKASNSWTPKATISVLDNSTNKYVALQGVEVRARWWFNWEKGFTDVNGKATMSGSFKEKVNWSIVWDSQDWDIRDGYYGQAFFNGPEKSQSDWTLQIGANLTKSFGYGHIHRACYDYWNNQHDLKKPYRDNFWKQKIKIGLYEKVGKSYFDRSYAWSFGSIIAIYSKKDERQFEKAYSIYSTTIHELAHVSHWDIEPDIFNKCGRVVIESFAVGIEYVFTSQIYTKEQMNFLYLQDVNFQTLTENYRSIYTPLVIDLMDTFNQRAEYDYSYPIDNVSGYTISQIENAIKGVRTLEEWRDNLKNMYDNPTEIYLDELFNNYINWR